MNGYVLRVVLISSLTGQVAEELDALGLFEMAGSRELSMESGFAVLDVRIPYDAPDDESDEYSMRDELGERGALRLYWDAERWSIEVVDHEGSIIRHLRCDGSYIDTGDGHIWTHDYWTNWMVSSDDKGLFSSSMWPYSVAFGWYLFPISLGRQLDYISKLSFVYVMGTETKTEDESGFKVEFFYRPTGMETSFTPPESPEVVYEMVEIDGQLIPRAIVSLNEGQVFSRSTYRHGDTVLNGLYVVESCAVEARMGETQGSPLLPIWSISLREVSPLLESSFDESMFLVEPGPEHRIHVLPEPGSRRRVKVSRPPTVVDVVRDYVRDKPFEAAGWVVGVFICGVVLRIVVVIGIEIAESRKS